MDVLLQITLLKIYFEGIFRYILDTPDSIHVAIHDVAQLKDRHYLIPLHHRAHLHLGAIGYHSHHSRSGSATSSGLPHFLRSPVRLSQRHTINAKHVGSPRVKERIGMYMVIDGGLQIDMSVIHKGQDIISCGILGQAVHTS